MLQAEPMRIVNAEISRPKAKGDITLKQTWRSPTGRRSA
jgi:hypothetical protein